MLLDAFPLWKNIQKLYFRNLKKKKKENSFKKMNMVMSYCIAVRGHELKLYDQLPTNLEKKMLLKN